MTTFTQMVDDVLSELRGYVRDQQQSTHITADVSASDTDWTVHDATAVSVGRAEIGDEIVWISAVDRTTNSVTIAPYGRGMDGTTAAAHSTNDRLVGNPSFPRVNVKRALNDTIKSVADSLFAVATTEFTFVAGVVGYELPATAEGVLAVTWEPPDPTQLWPDVRRWRFNRSADTTDFSTGRSLDVYDPIVPGSTVRVVYRKDATVLSADADVFTTVTGMPASCEDVIRLGALARLSMGLDAFQVQTRSIEANTLVGRVQPGQGGNVSKYYYAMYQQRFNEERDSLLNKYPTRVHFVR